MDMSDGKIKIPVNIPYLNVLNMVCAYIRWERSNNNEIITLYLRDELKDFIGHMAASLTLTSLFIYLLYGDIMVII